MVEYGRPHRRVKERLIAEWRANPYPCRRCGRPMSEPAEELHAGHPDDGGPFAEADALEDPHCNMSAGAALTNGRDLRASRQW